ncbi:MAG TPA: hypothetical protein VFT98_07765 [Myxococcota bacterium]|nr:hypothetical protein [Myxococcota bacterium]
MDRGAALWLRALWPRIAFVAVVTFFHVANFVLLNVQFRFMPFVFFDLTPLAARLAPRLAMKPAG